MKRKGSSGCSDRKGDNEGQKQQQQQQQSEAKAATATSATMRDRLMMNAKKVQAVFIKEFAHYKRITKQSMGSTLVFVAVFCLLCILDGSPTSSSYYYSNMVSSSAVNDATNPSASFHKDDEDSESQCPIHTATSPTHKVRPTFLASFPGSGSKLSWQMTQALTGIITTDDVYSNGQTNAVGIKTHYPCPEGKEAAGSERIPRVILFVRHPMDAIAAYHDFIFAIANNLTPGETHAPYDHWIKWRDSNFDVQIKTWRKHLEYWMDRYSKLNRLVLPYEKFILEDDGPQMAERMAEFLSRGEGVVTVAPEKIPCIWRTVVSNNMGSNGIRRRRRRQLRRRLLEKHIAATTTDNRQHGSHQRLQRALQQETTPQQQAVETANAEQQQKPPTQQQEGQEDPQPNTKTEQNDNQQPQQTPSDGDQSQQQELENGMDQQKQPNTNQMGALPQIDIYARPFADTQKKEIVVALAQLLEKYRDDKVLAPILVGYIDQVTSSKQSI